MGRGTTTSTDALDLTLYDVESAARVVHAVMAPTPQYRWPLLGEHAGADVWLKHENHTPSGAFKVRGGVVFFDTLRRTRPDVRGVITATRGNHGQSIAMAAAQSGIEATVVVPLGNSVEKNEAMRAFGARLIERGVDFQEAREHAERLATGQGLLMVSSFDRDFVRGVASYALELFHAVPDLDTVYVPIGLGSGICGVIAARDLLGQRAEVVGVVSDLYPAYLRSFEAAEPVRTEESPPTIADGMACRVPEPAAVAMIRRGAARIIAVSDDEIAAAMRQIFVATHNVAEGGGAAAYAALVREREAMRGKRVAVILSGGNVDRDVFSRVLAAG